MLLLMNFLIGMVFFGGWALAKSAWSDGKKLKAIGIVIVDLIVCCVLIAMKETMKKENRAAILGY